MNSEVVFWHQLKHQRTISGTIGKARRKWKYNMAWFPLEQTRLFAEYDRIYEEAFEKYGLKMFAEYAFRHKLNERIYDPRVEVEKERKAEELRKAQMKLLGPQCPEIASVKSAIYIKKERPFRL